MLGTVSRGVKRTLVAVEADVITQRQSILDISMCKLQTLPVRKVEPSLRRSVLIFNTLKHIEQELHNEGVRVYPVCKSSIIPSIQPEDSQMDVLPSLLNTETCKTQEDLAHRSSDLSQPMDTSCDRPCDGPPSTVHSANTLYEDYHHLHITHNTHQTVEDMLTDLDLTVFDMDLLTVNSSPKLSAITGEDLDLFAPVMPITCKSDLLLEDFDNLFQQVFVTS